MDPHTETHFQAWLERTIAADEREHVEAAMRELISHELDLLQTHSWPEIRALAQA